MRKEKEVLFMQVFVPIWIAEAVCAALFILAGYPITTKKSFTFKMLSCVLYMANGLYAYSLSAKGAYGVTILVGLAFGWLGDVFLALDPFVRHKQNRKLSLVLFVIGGFFFLLGHIAYMAAFLRLLLSAHAFRVLPFLLTWGGVLLCIALTFILCKVKAGKFFVPIAIYAAGLSGMCALAICCAVLVFGGHTVTQCILIAAPLLFAFSDVTLALRSMDKERFESLTMRSICLVPYFLAQMLLGLSVWLA